MLLCHLANPQRCPIHLLAGGGGGAGARRRVGHHEPLQLGQHASQTKQLDALLLHHGQRRSEGERARPALEVVSARAPQLPKAVPSSGLYLGGGSGSACTGARADDGRRILHRRQRWRSWRWRRGRGLERGGRDCAQSGGGGRSGCLQHRDIACRFHACGKGQGMGAEGRRSDVSVEVARRAKRRLMPADIPLASPTQATSALETHPP